MEDYTHGMSTSHAMGRWLSRWMPVLLLLLFAAGSAAHFEHHLLDPDCDARPDHAACATCAAFHGGMTVATTAEAPTLSLPEAPEVLWWTEAAPAIASRAVVSARAPPAS